MPRAGGASSKLFAGRGISNPLWLLHHPLELVLGPRVARTRVRMMTALGALQ